MAPAAKRRAFSRAFAHAGGMPRLLILVLALLSSTSLANEIRVLTFNIRYNNPMDGANAWPLRQDAVAKLIRERADVAGLQEVKPDQRAWLVAQLPEFEFVGVGRAADGADESVPVAFRKERFEVLSSGTFWLSEKPEAPGSTSWGNKLPRIATWAKLQDRKDGKPFWFYNVHLDHQSGLAREKGLALVADRIVSRTDQAPAIMVGDLNSTVGDGPLAALALRKDPAWLSTFEALNVPPEGTFHGFTGKTGTKAIDFILLETGRWKVTAGKVLKTTYAGTDGVERFVSDHFPVEATVIAQP